MNTSKQRIKAIKEKTLKRDSKYCFSCGNSIHPGQKVFHVRRYKLCTNGKIGYCNFYYCKDCMKSKNDVLLTIDSDEYPEGIYKIDPLSTEGYNGYGMKPEIVHNIEDYSIDPDDYADFFE